MFEECLYFNSNALARAVTKLWTEAYKPFDLSPPHAFLLRAVLAQPGLQPKQLADELNLSRSTVTRFLDSLEARGLLQRTAGSADAREWQVHPTPEAQAMHAELDATGARLTTQMRRLFGKAVVGDTVATLRQMQQKIDQL